MLLFKLSQLFYIMTMVGFLNWGCSNIELDSKWRDRDIIIDGDNDEWQDTMILIDDPKLSIGFYNDGEFLYLSFTSNDRNLIPKIKRRGLILWFDPEGGKKKVFGLQFPLGMHELGRSMMTMRNKNRDDYSDSQIEAFKESLEELIIFTAGDEESKRMRISESGGIETKIANSSETLIYEAKVPIIKGSKYPFAIGTQAGRRIGIGLEIPEIDKEQMRKEMKGRSGGMGGGIGRGGRGGGGFGGGGGGGGMRGGRMKGGRPAHQEALKIWIKVQLASLN